MFDVSGRENRQHGVVRQFDERGSYLFGTPAGRNARKCDLGHSVGERFLASNEAIRVNVGRRGRDSFHVKENGAASSVVKAPPATDGACRPKSGGQWKTFQCRQVYATFSA